MIEETLNTIGEKDMAANTLTGEVHTWEAFGHRRTFGVVTLPFERAKALIKPQRYNALTGKGEQRSIFDSHMKKLRSAIESGDYTPTPVSANLSKKHQDHLKVRDGFFTLKVNDREPLLLTDGGHRFEALSSHATSLSEALENKDLSEADKKTLKAQLDSILNAPITVTLYFDGDAKRDFVNLQAGRPVDAAHMFSLKVQQKVLSDPEFKLAFDTATILGKSDKSPFKNLIRFDSRGDAPLPISTLCGKGASDLATSLIGLAKVGLAAEKTLSAEDLAFAVCATFEAIKSYDEAHETEIAILENGKVLTPIGNGGKKGQATMLIGVATCLAYRLSLSGKTKPDKGDLEKLVAAVKATLDQEVNGNLSGPVKRKLIGNFAKNFFADVQTDKHQKIPVGLISTLSASTFGVEPLPKSKREKVKTQAQPAAEQNTGKKKGRKGAHTNYDEETIESDSAEDAPWDEPPEDYFNEAEG